MWQPNFDLFLNNFLQVNTPVIVFGVSSKANIKLKRVQPLDTQ